MNQQLISINQSIELLIKEISDTKNESDRIEYINLVKQKLHDISPFRNEPVDCVLWLPFEKVAANDYNPNKVAPPEMELLRVSIDADGYTQPIVVFEESKDKHIIVDGFHRHRVAKECEEITKRINGYLPCTVIRNTQIDKSDRIAATIRHNRARGKHQIQEMSKIVLELKRRNWTDNKIAKNLGMDADEILRLTQISGLHEMFSDQEFSLSWEVQNTKEDELDVDVSQ